MKRLGAFVALVTLTLILLEVAGNASHFEGNYQIYSMDINGSSEVTQVPRRRCDSTALDQGRDGSVAGSRRSPFPR